MSGRELMWVYLLGAAGYGGLESFWQGHTHWTMLLLGGVCFLVIYLVTVRLRLRFWLKVLLCAAAITGLEFLSGCLLNLWLGWEIWDYGRQPGNLLGQICPRYACYWLLLSIPCCSLAWAIRQWLFPAREGAEN